MIPVSGIEPRHAAHDHERLHGQARGQPDGEQLAEPVLAQDRGAEPADDEGEEQQQDGDAAEQPELLTDRREDEVRRGERDQVRAALAEAGARRCRRWPARTATGRAGSAPPARSAAGSRACSQMSTRACDVREREVADRGADGEQHEPRRQVRAPGRGHVEHHDEDREEQQRGAQVRLQEQDGQGHAPRHEQRGRGAWARGAGTGPACGSRSRAAPSSRSSRTRGR